MAEAQHHRRRRTYIKAPELPDDVIFNNILPRLPARSVIICYTVSKQWYFFLKSPTFTNVHNKRLTNVDYQNNHKLLVLSIERPYRFNTVDCETLTVGSCRFLPFKENIEIKSSCNGLVLGFLKSMKTSSTALSDLILWNPLTTEYKSVTKPYSNPLSTSDELYDLYYNSSDEDYRILHVSRKLNPKVYIYSLKSESWRMIDSNNALQCIARSIAYSCLPSICFNEYLYFLKEWNYSITRFDTKTELFTVIVTPSFIQERRCFGLMAQRGCIYLCVEKCPYSFGSYIELWRMKRDGKWKKVSTYYRKQGIDILREPRHLMRNGNLLIKSKWSYYLYKLDTKKKMKMDEKNKKKHQHHRRGKTHLYNLGGFTEHGRYIESFVSPNQYAN